MANATNASAVTFSTPVNTDPTHFGYWTAATGGTFLGGDSITTNVAAGASFRFPAGDLDIGMTTGDLTEAGRRKALAGVVLGGVWVSLHTGNPGSTGASQVTGTPYARQNVVQTSWTIT